ncbi:hypothetical protein DFR33_101324 [Bradymonas sediminis]|nr:hypothetical protein DFR33_101324 [Bradymonas sediminis]
MLGETSIEQNFTRKDVGRPVTFPPGEPAGVCCSVTLVGCHLLLLRDAGDAPAGRAGGGLLHRDVRWLSVRFTRRASRRGSLLTAGLGAESRSGNRPRRACPAGAKDFGPARPASVQPPPAGLPRRRDRLHASEAYNRATAPGGLAPPEQRTSGQRGLRACNRPRRACPAGATDSMPATPTTAQPPPAGLPRRRKGLRASEACERATAPGGLAPPVRQTPCQPGEKLNRISDSC